MNLFFRFRHALSAACLLVTPGWAYAAYPEKPIKLIVTFAPGGASDG